MSDLAVAGINSPTFGAAENSGPSAYNNNERKEKERKRKREKEGRKQQGRRKSNALADQRQLALYSLLHKPVRIPEQGLRNICIAKFQRNHPTSTKLRQGASK